MTGNDYSSGEGFSHSRSPSGDSNNGNSNSLFNDVSFQNGQQAAGVVFWIQPENMTAITSMKVVINYPSEMQPDIALGDTPLKCLYWNSVCGSSNTTGYWSILDTSLVQNVSSYSDQITLNEPGCYAFGQDILDYSGSSNNSVPGYPVALILAFSALSLAVIIRKKIDNGFKLNP